MPHPELSVVPASSVSFAELQAVFGKRGDAARCQCQWFRVLAADWRLMTIEERAERLRAQTGCGEPGARETSGLVARLGEEPVGWCAVAPRREHARLKVMPVPWAGRHEDREDPGVWAVTCFVTRAGYRRQGVSRALAAAAVGFAQARGARALEGYPMVPKPGQEVTWGQMFVGARSAFAAAGFREVTRPFPRRVVMRIDFDRPPA